MKVLAREKFKVLAETNGWSLDHAQGFVDGESSRRRGKPPSKYALIGIDEYCLGFRAGYFERQQQSRTRAAESEAPRRAFGFELGR